MTSSAPELDEELHATAVKDAFGLLLADLPVLDLDEVKAMRQPPVQYLELTVERRVGGVQRISSAIGSTAWRITSRAVGRTVAGAREVRRRSADIERSVITITSGLTTTPVDLESQDPIGPDEGWWSGLTTYTFTT